MRADFDQRRADAVDHRRADHQLLHFAHRPRMPTNTARLTMAWPMCSSRTPAAGDRLDVEVVERMTRVNRMPSGADGLRRARMRSSSATDRRALRSAPLRMEGRGHTVRYALRNTAARYGRPPPPGAPRRR